MRAAIPFHLLVKPAGPRCNLDCAYCFYTEKQALFGAGIGTRMTDDTLRALVRAAVEAMPGNEIPFAWQGGEPTLMGIEFFEKVLAYQREVSDGRKITNALQTNGTLLDERWAVFLKKHDFLVGLSLDGPEALHNAYRKTRDGQGAWSAAMRGLKWLQRYGVATNALCVINAANAAYPREVYRFMREAGVRYLQFIPLVERARDAAATHWGLRWSSPPRVGAHYALSDARDAQPRTATPESVPAAAWGDFLSGVFAQWVRRDVGRMFVTNFESFLAKYCGMKGGSCCTHGEVCGRSLVVEHTGDVYACDHFVYPDYRLGNVRSTPLAAMADDPRQLAFGLAKRDALPAQCRACKWRFACAGECPKHRFLKTADGEEGLNYLCEGYRRFFEKTEDDFRALAALVQEGKSPAEIMRR